MTEANQDLVHGLLNSVMGSGGGGGGGGGGSGGGGGGGAVDLSDARVDVDPEDVERKSWQALEKKGFPSAEVSRAMLATQAMVVMEGDRRRGRPCSTPLSQQLQRLNLSRRRCVVVDELCTLSPLRSPPLVGAQVALKLLKLRYLRDNILSVRPSPGGRHSTSRSAAARPGQGGLHY